MQAPRDCSDEGSYTSGIYMTTTGHGNIPTFCDMSTDGKRWVVILRREYRPHNLPVDFNVNWDNYKWGFGSLFGEFWWGLEYVWRLTTYPDREYELRINMVDFHGNHKFALYQKFRVTSEEDGYRLIVGNYSGNAYDGLRAHNGMKFTTFDRDNDERCDNCAMAHLGGWWFKNCYSAHLTGRLGNMSNSNGQTCWQEHKICWAQTRPWRYVPLKKVTMLIRPSWIKDQGCY